MRRNDSLKLGKLFRPSIRNKLFGAFACVLLIPSLSIGIISYQSAASKVDEQISETAMGNVELFNGTVDRFIQPEMDNIDYLAGQITKNTFEGKDPTAVKRDLMAPFLAAHPEVSVVDLGTPSKLYINSKLDKMPDGYDCTQRPWYIDAMSNKGKVIVTSPYESKTTGDFVIGISKVVKDSSSVVHAEIKIDTIAKMVTDVKIGNSGYLYIIDKDSKYVVHPKNKPGAEAKGEQYEAMLKNEKGTQEYTLNGSVKKMMFTTNQITGWRIAGTFDQAEVTQEASAIFKVTLLVVAISIVVGTLLVYFIVRSITQPLKRLMTVSDKIGLGDLTDRVEVKSKDEFGQLSERFNRMTDSLRSVLMEVGQTASQLAASSEQLSASAEQTSRATEQVATTIQEVAMGTDKQVQSVEESTKAVHEMSAGVQQIAANAQSVSASAIEASEAALAGNESIQNAVNQMSSISSTVNGLAQVIKDLGARSHEIGQIVEVITSIAGQTNLLALNAAIEAARAGEHGRGFAVVADEVRKLAEQSSASALQIANLIKSIQSETENAVQSMETATEEVANGIGVVNSAGSSFEHIYKSVDRVTQQIQEVSAASQQMSAGTGQVVTSMDRIADVSEGNAAGTQTVSAAAEEQLASMEEITASANSLSRMADDLQKLVGKFKV